jgi:hypothetical protein
MKIVLKDIESQRFFDLSTGFALRVAPMHHAPAWVSQSAAYKI